MEPIRLQSENNEYIKRCVKLKQKKYRTRFALFGVEGLRNASDAPQDMIDSVVMTETFYESGVLRFDDTKTVVVPDNLFSKLCDTQSPQGVIAYCKIPSFAPFTAGRYLYCDGISDPGNAGTVIRSADAFGFSGVMFSSDSVDIYAPKVVRSAMGSLFHIPVCGGVEVSTLAAMQKNGFFVSATVLDRDSVSPEKCTVCENQVFVIGNEANGVSDNVRRMADETVFIPMAGKAESLNAGVAASIIMYEMSKR